MQEGGEEIAFRNTLGKDNNPIYIWERRNRMKKVATFLVIVLAFLLIGISSHVLAIDKIKLGTAIKEPPEYYLPILAAEEQGLWKKNDLEVEWVPFKGSPLLFSAMATGDIKVGIANVTGPIQAISRGLPITNISDLHPNTAYTLFVRPDSKYRDPRDLKGATLGTARLGTLAHCYSIIVAKTAGIDKTVKYVGTGGAIESIAALKSGAIDAYLLTTTVFAEMLVKGELRQIAQMKDYLPKEWLMEVVFAHKDFVRERPDAVKRVVKAIGESIEFVNKNPDWAIKKIRSESGFSEEAARFTLQAIRFAKDLRLSRKAMGNVIDFCVEYEIIKKEQAPSADEIIPKEFAR